MTPMVSQSMKADWHRRVRYRCRRGMLELDTVLKQAFDQHFATLSDQDQQLFANMLEEEDTVLLMWLTGREVPEDEQMARLIKEIT